MTLFQKLIIIILSIFLLSISLCVGYYVFHYLPEKEKLRIELLEQREKNIYECLRGAENYKQGDWNKQCEVLDLRRGCALPDSSAGYVNERNEKMRAECYKRFDISP